MLLALYVVSAAQLLRKLHARLLDLVALWAKTESCCNDYFGRAKLVLA